MSKRIRIYTAEDIAEHRSSSSCWVSRNGKVYDITKFLDDHPGGDDIVLKHAGLDVGEIMKDPTEHEHSDSAYDMLDEFFIGRLGTGEAIVSDDWEITDDFEPEETDTVKDFEKNQFLDLRKPLLRQVWEANWSKSYYLLQVHQPRHLTDSAPMFGPPFLEVCLHLRFLASVLTLCSGLHQDVVVCHPDDLATHCHLPLPPLFRPIYTRKWCIASLLCGPECSAPCLAEDWHPLLHLR